jgi:hypothetical protein
LAKKYLGDSGSKLVDADAREKITKQTMLEKSLQLTVQRVADESRSGKAPGATTSIFKIVGSTVAKDGSSLKSELRGIAGVAGRVMGSPKRKRSPRGVGCVTGR